MTSTSLYFVIRVLVGHALIQQIIEFYHYKILLVSLWSLSL